MNSKSDTFTLSFIFLICDFTRFIRLQLYSLRIILETKFQTKERSEDRTILLIKKNSYSSCHMVTYGSKTLNKA